MGPIIAATNFSKTSDSALEYAASVAKVFNVKLIIFNAFKIPVHMHNTRFSAQSMADLVALANKRLQKLSAKIASTYGIEVQSQCSYVDLEHEIDALMTTQNAELLVMGMSKKSMEQNLLGNPTTTLISMKKFPVLAVPVNAKFSAIQSILFACDLKDSIPLKTVVHLKRMAQKLNSKVTVFYVEQKINELLDSPQNTIIDKGLENVAYVYKKVNSDTIISAIEDEIVNTKPDLLVMVPKAYGFWESIIHKSKTRVMASGLNIPMLSIPVETP